MEETSAPCTFGTHLNKVEFELKQAVSELGFELELPSSIKIARVENAYIYNNTSKNLGISLGKYCYRCWE